MNKLYWEDFLHCPFLERFLGFGQVKKRGKSIIDVGTTVIQNEGLKNYLVLENAK
jgi:hypothetical protein